MEAKIETSITEAAEEDILVESEDADKEDADNVLERDENGDEEPAPFSEKTWIEDLTLTVEGRNLHVSKAVLAVISPVFRKMFEDQIEIPLSGKRYADFLEFLLCVYPNPKTLQKIDKNNVMVVVPLIVEFKVGHLIETCKDVLSNIVDNLESVEDLLYYFLKMSEIRFERLKQHCLSLLILKNIRQIKNAMNFSELPSDLKIELLTELAEKLTETVDRKTKINSEQEKSLRSCQMFKEYLLSCRSNADKEELEKFTHCQIIEHEFEPTNQISFSEYVRCDSNEMAIKIGNSGCSFYNDKHRFETSIEFKHRNSMKCKQKFVLVNNHSNKTNVTLETTGNSHSEINKNWSVKWDDLKDDSKGFIKNGKVKIIAII